MNNTLKNFIINYKKLLKFDTIKKLRFIEIFQYSTIGIILALLIGRITEHYIFSNSLNGLIQLNVLKKKDEKIYLNIENNISQISFSKDNVYFFDKEKIRIKKS